MHVQAIRLDDDGHLVGGFRWFELDLGDKVANLLDLDNARLGFRPDPMDIWMITVVDAAATEAGVAGINGHAVGRPPGVLAVEGLGQSASQRFEFGGGMPGEEVGGKSRSPDLLVCGTAGFPAPWPS